MAVGSVGEPSSTSSSTEAAGAAGGTPRGGTPGLTSLSASLSARSRETAELRQRLHSVQQQVQLDEGPTASDPLKDSESWNTLQSAHAHMLLLEARLAELST